MEQSIKDALLATFSYNPETGIFLRKTDIIRENGRPTQYKAGQRAGSVVGPGYRTLQFSVNSITIMILEHRAAFIFMGENIPNMVDHINGIRTDNRWSNLRATSPSDNQFNRYIKSGKNKDLPVGVYRHQRKGRPGMWYTVRIAKNGKEKCTTTRSLENALQKAKQFREEMWKENGRTDPLR